MAKVLELVFKNAGGSKKTISIAAPKEDITGDEANAAMDAVIAANVIETTGGDLVERVEARIKETDVTILG